MLCETFSKNKKILFIGILGIFLILGCVLAIGSEFMEKETKIIISGKYQITISGDEYKWVDTVSIINGQVKIIAKDKIDRKGIMPDTLLVFDKKSQQTSVSKSISKGEDIFTYTMKEDDEYLKFGTSSIVIILIIDADHLNSTRGWIKDVYDKVSGLDNITSTINSEEYLRVKFQQNLTSDRDITIYASSKNGANVEVYEKDSDVLIADFGNLGSEIQMYKIYLTNLSNPNDVFDLKVVGGNVEFDYVFDPIEYGTAYNSASDIYGILGEGTNKTGALNVTFQIRSCDDVACSGETFVGPDNTSLTYFTNATLNTLNETLTPNNTYFQYKAFFNTEDQNYSSMLFNVTVGYTDTDSTPPTFTDIPNNVSEDYLTANVYAYFNATDTNFGGFYLNDTSNFTIDYTTGILTNKTPLFADSYALNVTINDTSLNTNWTIFTIQVNKINPTASIIGNASIDKGTLNDVRSSESNSGDADLTYTLYRDGTLVSSPDTSNLIEGFYSYILNTTGGLNYTSNSSLDTFNLEVKHTQTGGDPGSSSSSETETKTDNPKKMDMVYKARWQRNKQNTVDIEIYDSNNQKYRPDDLYFEFNIEGLTLIRQEYNEQTKIFSNVFKLEDDVILGENIIKAFARDDKTITGYIEFEIVEFNHIPETETKTTSTEERSELNEYMKMVLLIIICFMVLIFLTIIIITVSQDKIKR